MSIDLDNRVYGALLAIWMGFVLNTTPFSLTVAFAFVFYVFFLIIFLKRSFMAGARLPVRLGVHTLTLFFCLMLPAALSYVGEAFLPQSAQIDPAKLYFLIIVVGFWVLSSEVARFARGDPAYIWIEERGEFQRL